MCVPEDVDKSYEIQPVLKVGLTKRNFLSLYVFLIA